MSSFHNPLNFFRIILPVTLQQGKLPLPKGFGRKYGKTLSNMVLIKLPDGVKWKMNWTKHDGQIWLEKGWNEFVKFYSISVGYFLVFKYEGNSHFQVLIFDTSCLEIAYPVLLGTDDGDDDESNKGDSVEVIHECNNARPESPVHCSRPHKIAKTIPVVETACSDRLKAENSRIGRKRLERIKTHLDIHAAKKRFIGNEGGTSSFGRHSKCESNRSKEPLSFQKLFSFKVEMHPTYLTTNCLHFPRNHGMNDLNKNGRTVILQVSDEKTWPVSYKFSNGRGTLTNGWLSFVRANNLKKGDVCSFKMIESNGVSFIVSIHRANEVSTTPFSQGNRGGSFNSGKHSECETNRNKMPLSFKKPVSFVIEMHPSYLRTNCLHVPGKHGMNYLSKKNEGTVILQLFDGKTWPVSYKFSNGRGRLTNGWLSFVRANNLKVGDVCIFKMIESNGVSFIVSILRANEVSTAPLSQGQWATDKPSSAFYEQAPLSMHEKSEVPKACRQFDSDVGFSIFMRSCLLENTRPSIPVDFIRRHVRRNKQYVTLQVGRKLCHVKLVYYPIGSYARFTTGWSSFVREFDLRAGHVCHFQLIDEDEGKLVLKVSVEKHLEQGMLDVTSM